MGKNIKFDYYYGKEADQFSFYRIPKLLFADNNDGFADEALGLLRDVKDQSVREILLKQIRALI